MALPNNIFIELKLSSSLNTFIKRENYSACFIICDTNTLTHCLSPLILACPVLKDAEVIELEPGEETKDIAIATSIWETLTNFGADKKSLIINLGGGVVCDIGGFSASVFKRGIDFINIPTSLLAMADASVGGKTGINFSGIKNHIGTIIQPKAVFIYTSFLASLPERHLKNGFAEILKIALISDLKFFRLIENLVITSGFHDLKIITRSVELKYKVVKKDPEEKNLRKILNFGHTAGHAIESLFLQEEKSLLHGEAIAVGMIIESYISLLQKRITKNDFEKIHKSLQLNFNFPPISKNKVQLFFNFFDQDKKHLNRQYRLALLNGIGKCDPEVPVKKVQVEKAIEFYNSKITNAVKV